MSDTPTPSTLSQSLGQMPDVGHVTEKEVEEGY